MFLIGDFELRGIYDGIIGTKKGEADGEEEGEPD